MSKIFFFSFSNSVIRNDTQLNYVILKIRILHSCVSKHTPRKEKKSVNIKISTQKWSNEIYHTPGSKKCHLLFSQMIDLFHHSMTMLFVHHFLKYLRLTRSFPRISWQRHYCWFRRRFSFVGYRYPILLYEKIHYFPI